MTPTSYISGHIRTEVKPQSAKRTIEDLLDEDDADLLIPQPKKPAPSSAPATPNLKPPITLGDLLSSDDEDEDVPPPTPIFATPKAPALVVGPHKSVTPIAVTPMSAPPMSATPMRVTSMSFTPLSSTHLSSTHLSSTPLSATYMAATAKLCGDILVSDDDDDVEEIGYISAQQSAMSSSW